MYETENAGTRKRKAVDAQARDKTRPLVAASNTAQEFVEGS